MFLASKIMFQFWILNNSNILDLTNQCLPKTKHKLIKLVLSSNKHLTNEKKENNNLEISHPKTAFNLKTVNILTQSYYILADVVIVHCACTVV